MKRNIFLIAVTAINVSFFQSCKKEGIATAKQTNASQEAEIRKSLSKGLMAYYTFTGNTLDSSGNNNNVIFNNCTPTTDRYGNPDGAYLFK